ncbi:hypothetical protein [Fischerella sp. NIES-3754]|uniref:hypothetical protein n=1 Tax=Fischerella sp. NIES-3754 TaxID=1752063 RepID=UPI0015D8B6F2|nr:hypothetical protein [Fischerella sp. NIES-3754]BCX08022.1 MAG: hypothetical protein KatS3mg066_1881 [Fischerella sp.]
MIHPGDVIILYGRLDAFSELDSGKAGISTVQPPQEAIAPHEEQMRLESEQQNSMQTGR